MKKLNFLLCLFVLSCSTQDRRTSWKAPEVDSPEKFFGFKVGEDRKLFTYTKLLEYLRELETKSKELRVVELGKSTLGNPFAMVVVASESNLKNLDDLRDIARALADPHSIRPDAVDGLIKRGKVFVCVTLNIHSSEIASSQMAAELAFDLVSHRTPFEFDKVFNDVVLLLIPSLNPDGQIMIADWYNKYVGTEFEGGPMPYLYHHYAGHDNNRDWFAFNLVESVLASNVFYRDWVPQVILDEHQMGQTGARMFVPPYKDPPHPEVHPLVWRNLATFGTAVAADLERAGKSGVQYGEIFTGWWPGTSIMTPWWHNQVGILFELASCRIATPIYVEPNEVGEKQKMSYPSPWKGGWWRMRDIVDYELIGTFSVLENAALNREKILRDAYTMAQDAIRKGEGIAFVIPKNQRDPAALVRLLEMLKIAGVRIGQADDSFVIDMAQAKSRYVQVLFETQRYPEWVGNPYDVAGWTIPMQMGIEYRESRERFELQAAETDTQGFRRDRKISPYMSAESTDSVRYINRALKAGAVVLRSSNSGTVIRPDMDDSYCSALALKFTEQIGESDSAVTQRGVRLGLYKPWNASMDEGWTRLLLERYEFPFASIDNKRMKEGNLGKDFDCILLPSMNEDVIVDGTEKQEKKSPERLPPEFRGGIGKEGVEAMEKFIQEGGTLICLAQSCNLAMNRFPIPVTNALKNAGDKFACPGSILRVECDNTHPISWGMSREFAGYFSDGLAFNTSVPFGNTDRKVVAWYSDSPVLMSGWLKGEDQIAKKAAVVETRWEKGRVILFGFPVQFRAQTFGTFKLLFNAIHSCGIR